jgi:hypothetical protein
MMSQAEVELLYSGYYHHCVFGTRDRVQQLGDVLEGSAGMVSILLLAPTRRVRSVTKPMAVESFGASTKR